MKRIFSTAITAVLFSVFCTQSMADDCSHASSFSQIAQCQYLSQQKTEKKLNKVYQELLGDVTAFQKNYPSGRPNFRKELIKSEISWINFRKEFCKMDANRFYNGASYNIEYPGCLETLAKSQIKNLQGEISAFTNKQLFIPHTIFGQISKIMDGSGPTREELEGLFRLPISDKAAFLNQKKTLMLDDKFPQTPRQGRQLTLDRGRGLGLKNEIYKFRYQAL